MPLRSVVSSQDKHRSNQNMKDTNTNNTHSNQSSIQNGDEKNENENNGQASNDDDNENNTDTYQVPLEEMRAMSLLPYVSDDTNTADETIQTSWSSTDCTTFQVR